MTQPRRLAEISKAVIGALFIIMFGVSNSAEAADVNPLRPVDASSPRATLQGFIEMIDEAYLGMAEVLKSYEASNRLYLSSEERKRQIEALLRGTRLSNLSTRRGFHPFSGTPSPSSARFS
jgi:hypothetical protein